MVTIPLPKPIAVKPFDPGPQGETYSSIFADTMGNAATPTDGFYDKFGAMAALTDSVRTIADLDPADVSSVSDLAAGFSQAIEGDLAQQIQPAADATDAALSTYAGLTQPPVNPTPPVGPPPTQPPAPSPAQDCSAPAGEQTTTLAAMKVGDAPVDVYIDDESLVLGELPKLHIALGCGDKSIFRTHIVREGIGPIIQGGQAANRTAYLTVTPNKAGKFLCTVVENLTNQNPGTFKYYFQVTIV
jgi:hypothetical protein